MKIFKLLRIIMVLSFFLLTLSCGISIEKNDTPEQFGELIFNTLKSNDIEKFSNYIPTQEDFKKLLVQSSYDEETKKKSLAGCSEIIKKMNEELIEDFTSVRREAEKAGIDWSKTKFVRVEYEVEKKDDIEIVDIYIIFTYIGLSYKIKLDDCVKSHRGWLPNGYISWEG
ncbi:MAG: hypothetical protein KAT34_06960 [Candidatus Aminicenantes bacterium]|nr:hypothetical protein [Candidatus Aminicenantes bacterium]